MNQNPRERKRDDLSKDPTRHEDEQHVHDPGHLPIDPFHVGVLGDGWIRRSQKIAWLWSVRGINLRRGDFSSPSAHDDFPLERCVSCVVPLTGERLFRSGQNQNGEQAFPVQKKDDRKYVLNKPRELIGFWRADVAFRLRLAAAHPRHTPKKKRRSSRARLFVPRERA